MGIREFVRDTLRAESPDVFCLTESTDFFATDHAEVLASTEDYGYANDGDRRKVWLVSRHEWTAIELGEDSGLPPGRFVSGITEGIRFVGVCVPWFGANVSTGNKNRERWEDHIAYLRALGPILAGYAQSDRPVCVLGDFNQRIPATSRNARYSQYLDDIFGADYTVHTAGTTDVDGKQLIDHIATTRTLRFSLDRTLGRHADAGKRVSDHPALIGTLEGAPNDAREADGRSKSVG
ncbi:MAG TPA: endonuclease/exonuclease/phosphatase family protein [Methylomirabilota bacterium]|nr:endonuclease/exonuclease/phosphatase family protein [Methylomirabilota bacterium]